MKCFNRNAEGVCLAYTNGICDDDCPARMITIGQKINLLNCMIRYAKSKADRCNLSKELSEAYAFQEAEKTGQYEGWMTCYLGDLHRGEKGGASESDSNRRTSLKTLMKDNRPVGIKPTRDQLEAAKQATAEWEAENGKLERLGRSGVTHNKIDSYTDRPICFEPTGEGSETCRGQISASGAVLKDCKTCPYK